MRKILFRLIADQVREEIRAEIVAQFQAHNQNAPAHSGQLEREILARMEHHGSY